MYVCKIEHAAYIANWHFSPQTLALHQYILCYTLLILLFKIIVLKCQNVKNICLENLVFHEILELAPQNITKSSPHHIELLPLHLHANQWHKS